jgi:hypothetical protein
MPMSTIWYSVPRSKAAKGIETPDPRTSISPLLALLCRSRDPRPRRELRQHIDEGQLLAVEVHAVTRSKAAKGMRPAPNQRSNHSSPSPVTRSKAAKGIATTRGPRRRPTGWPLRHEIKGREGN